jgi:hypothetical protein
MRYDDLSEITKIGEKVIPDGYAGKTAKIAVHLVDGQIWYKAYCGCWRGLPVASLQGQVDILTGRQ